MTRYMQKSLLLFRAKNFKITKTPTSLSFFTITPTIISNIYNNTVYCQPCQVFTDTLVHRFVPIIKINHFAMVAEAIILFLPSSTTSNLHYHVPNVAFTTTIRSSHNADQRDFVVELSAIPSPSASVFNRRRQ
jgi:hypothetical protein